MGDDEHRAPGHQGIHPLLDELLRAGVDGGGGFIQDQHRGIGHGGPGNGQQLALPLAEAAAVAGDDGVVPLGQVADKGVGVGQPGRGADLLIGGVQLPVADVVGHGSGEQVGILQNNAQRAAQGVLPDVPDVDAVIGDGAGLNVIKPVDQVGNGGLSRAGGAHEGDLLAGLGKQGYVVEHRLFRVVAEVHMVKAHVAPQLRQGAVGLLPGPVAGAAVRLRQGIAVLQHPHQGGAALIRLGVGVHHGKNALRAGYGGQQGVHLLADLADGLAHLLHIQQVRAQGADIEHTGDGQQAAHAAGDGVVDAGEVAHGGHHGPGIGLGHGGGVAIGAVAGSELVHGLLLVVKDLDDLLALDHLLNVAIEAAQGRLLLLEADAAAAAHAFDHQEHQTQEHEGDEGQGPVQVNQHEHGAHKGNEVGHHAGEAVADHIGHGVHVVGEAAHQVAGLVGVEIPQGQGLEPVEQILPQGGHGPLGDADHQAGIGIGAPGGGQEHAAHGHQHPEQTLEVPGHNVVQGGLEEIAADHGAHGAEDQAHGHHDQRALVAADVAQELAHGAPEILGPLIAVSPAVGAAGTDLLLAVSHRWSLLPAEIYRPPDRSDWWPSAGHGCLRRKFCRRPAPRSDPHP